MELTAAEPRRKGLTQLFLDGEAAVRVDTETFLRSGLKPGDLLTDEELHSLLQASDARRAREKALYLLEHRSHSKRELTEKIARTAASREAAEAAADHMEELGLLNDESFARDYARELAGELHRLADVAEPLAPVALRGERHRHLLRRESRVSGPAVLFAVRAVGREVEEVRAVGDYSGVPQLVRHLVRAAEGRAGLK